MRTAFLTAFLLLSSNICRGQLVSENFESSSTNGWTTYGDATGFSWAGGEGNPNGCLRATDLNTGIIWGFRSGPAFAGDLSAAYGGTLTWDVRTTHPGTTVPTEPDVRIQGATLSLVMDLSAVSSTSWTSRSVLLTETAGWKKTSLSGATPTQAEMLSVLSSVVAFEFRPEYSNSVDTGRIDNVVISPCSLRADLNSDGAVDLVDLTAMLSNFGTPSGATLAQGDIDGNGAVNLNDLTLLLGSFGSTCP